MKLTLVGINAKYVHTNLAIRKLRAYIEAQGKQVCMLEFSGSEEAHRAVAKILQGDPEGVAFSCYIWNIETTLKWADILKKARPALKIILGGPEAMYNHETLFARAPLIDMIILGEGEKALTRLIQTGEIQRLRLGEPTDMADMPFPYTDSELAQRERIFYYESSRGCPYNCIYCLSSADKGVKYMPLPKVFADMHRFAAENVRLVKFVDRTFNSDLARAKEILRYLRSLECDTEFHIEVNMDTLDDEFIEILAGFGENKLRIETGLQSANSDTLRVICRGCNLERFAQNARKIIEGTQVILHMDLIAGLPYEDLDSFQHSFNFAFALRPHELQLGFLKILPGSEMARQAKQHEMAASDAPPYEIVKNKYIGFDALSRLKDLEAALDMYHNSGMLKETEPLLIKQYASPFAFFDTLGQFLQSEDLLSRPHHRVRQFEYLYQCIARQRMDTPEVKIALAKDYFTANFGAPMPLWATPFDVQINKEKLRALLHDDDALQALPGLLGVEKINRHKAVKIEKLFKMVWLVSNIDKKIVDITPYFSLDF